MKTQIDIRNQDYPRDSSSSISASTIFGTIDCHVRGWPTLGGVVIKSFTAVELDWLGLSPAKATSRSLKSQVEDKLSFRMLQLGAFWWNSERFRDYRSNQVRGGIPYPEDYPPQLDVGYPSRGGAWVLKRLSGELPSRPTKIADVNVTA